MSMIDNPFQKKFFFLLFFFFFFKNNLNKYLKIYNKNIYLYKYI